MVSPAGFEPAASGLGILRSIRLSYGDVTHRIVASVDLVEVRNRLIDI